jgi:Epoxide hydrolase N terminus
MKSAPSFNRRRLCGAAVATVAASPLGLSSFLFSQRSTSMNAQPKGSDAAAVRPFQVDFPDSERTELRRHISATQWPDRETVTDQSRGPRLTRYWETEYDWRKVEGRLNALANFIAVIDGLDIHFIIVHASSTRRLAM